jgi:hypothetical protein
MKKNIALTLVAVLALGLAACKEKSTSEVTEESNVNGTHVEKTTTTETTVEDDGDVSKETTTETTVDPEGLMNKETTTETHEESHTTE